MTKPHLNVYFFVTVNNLFVLGAHGVNIQFYYHPNFTGLAWESNSTSDCNNIPIDKQAAVYSIRTDTCFIAYWDSNCRSSSSEKFMPGDIIVSPNQLGRQGFINSFHICDEEEGGPQLDVDITDYFGSHFLHPSIIGSYKNVCSCVNIPKQVQNMTRWSIDNHHNALLVYFGPDCKANKWNPTFIQAGHSYQSRNMPFNIMKNRTNSTYKTESFGPDPNSTYFQVSCISSIVTTERTKIIETSTKTEVGFDLRITRFQTLNDTIVELRSQFDRLKINQEKFRNDILQQLWKLISEIKSGLHEMFAG